MQDIQDIQDAPENNQLRWLIRRNENPTREEVRALSEQEGIPIKVAYSDLVAQHPPVLQQWRESKNTWIDIAVEIEVAPRADNKAKNPRP